MKKATITIIIIFCISAAGYYLLSHIGDDVFLSDSFPSNTIINNIDCSKMTIEEASEQLTNEWNSHYITFTDETGILGSIKLNGVEYDIEDKLKTIRKDYFLNTVMNRLFGVPLEMTVKMNVSEYGKQFDKAISNADFINEKKIKETKNAYIKLNDPKLPIIKEVYGNTIDIEAIKKELSSLIADGTFKFHYVKSEFYKQPDITADNEDLLKRQEFYKENLISNVTYTLGKDIVVITPAQMAKFRGVKIASNGALTDDEIKSIKKAVSDNVLLEDVINEYVSSFAEKYNTLYSTRKFKTSKGKTVTIVGGDYGFALDQEAEQEQLIKDLTSGKPVKRDPLWAIKGFKEYAIGNDIGNTYVEVSIKNQHLWYYKNGKKIVECDIVTGNPYMGYSTPTGTFGLTYKQLGATLRGENADGSEYESPVSYWMPFYGNYGMHDATWRSTFGDDIYLGGGSHGCVNMPFDAAEKVYNNLADSNVPVVIYDK